MQNQLAARMFKTEKSTLSSLSAQKHLCSRRLRILLVLPTNLCMRERDGECWFCFRNRRCLCCSMKHISMFSFSSLLRFRKYDAWESENKNHYDSIYSELVRGWKVKVEQFILDVFMGFLCLSSAKYLYN